MPFTLNGIGTAICGERKLTQGEINTWAKYFPLVTNHVISDYMIGTESIVLLLPLFPLKTYVFCYTERKSTSKNYQILFYPGGKDKIYWEHVKSSIIFYSLPITIVIFLIWYYLFPDLFTGFNILVSFISFILIWYIGDTIYNARLKSVNDRHFKATLFIIVVILLAIVFILSLNTYIGRSSTASTGSSYAIVPPSAPIPVLTTIEPFSFERTNPTNISYRYTLKGKTDFIDIDLYKNLYQFVKENAPHDESSQDVLRNRQEIEIQNIEINKLVEKIKQRATYRDDEARIAISLVQNLRYSEPTERTLYEVLYEQQGACGEKSELLAYILNKLGYDVVLLKFPEDKHMAIGIKCSPQYSYQKSGYCFIETTVISIPTYSSGEYQGGGKLHKTYSIISISNQTRSFSTIGDEALDAAELDRIQSGQIERNDYNEMMHIFTKYGIPTSEPKNVNVGQMTYHYS